MSSLELTWYSGWFLIHSDVSLIFKISPVFATSWAIWANTELFISSIDGRPLLSSLPYIKVNDSKSRETKKQEESIEILTRNVTFRYFKLLEIEKSTNEKGKKREKNNMNRKLSITISNILVNLGGT